MNNNNCNVSNDTEPGAGQKIQFFNLAYTAAVSLRGIEVIERMHDHAIADGKVLRVFVVQAPFNFKIVSLPDFKAMMGKQGIQVVDLPYPNDPLAFIHLSKLMGRRLKYRWDGIRFERFLPKIEQRLDGFNSELAEEGRDAKDCTHPFVPDPWITERRYIPVFDAVRKIGNAGPCDESKVEVMVEQQFTEIATAMGADPGIPCKDALAFIRPLVNTHAKTCRFGHHAIAEAKLMDDREPGDPETDARNQEIKKNADTLGKVLSGIWGLGGATADANCMAMIRCWIWVTDHDLWDPVVPVKESQTPQLVELISEHWKKIELSQGLDVLVHDLEVDDFAARDVATPRGSPLLNIGLVSLNQRKEPIRCLEAWDFATAHQKVLGIDELVQVDEPLFNNAAEQLRACKMRLS